VPNSPCASGRHRLEASHTAYPNLADRTRADGICHNCEPPTIVIPPNLRHEYDAEGNVAHAGGSTLLALLIVPLVGAAIAAGRNPLPPDISRRPG
jgi:hypothetical protein